MKLLEIWWPYVRKGGYYIIEDLSWDNNNDQRLSLLETDLLPGGRAILEAHATFYVDTLFGHRNFSVHQNLTGDSSGEGGKFRPAQCCTRSRRLHNSHVVVVQKRDDSRPLRPFAPNNADERRRPMTAAWIETLQEDADGRAQARRKPSR